MNWDLWRAIGKISTATRKSQFQVTCQKFTETWCQRIVLSMPIMEVTVAQGAQIQVSYSLLIWQQLYGTANAKTLSKWRHSKANLLWWGFLGTKQVVTLCYNLRMFGIPKDRRPTNAIMRLSPRTLFSSNLCLWGNSIWLLAIVQGRQLQHAQSEWQKTTGWCADQVMHWCRQPKISCVIYSCTMVKYSLCSAGIIRWSVTN